MTKRNRRWRKTEEDTFSKCFEIRFTPPSNYAFIHHRQHLQNVWNRSFVVLYSLQQFVCDWKLKIKKNRPPVYCYDGVEQKKKNNKENVIQRFSNLYLQTIYELIRWTQYISGQFNVLFRTCRSVLIDLIFAFNNNTTSREVFNNFCSQEDTANCVAILFDGSWVCITRYAFIMNACKLVVLATLSLWSHLVHLCGTTSTVRNVEIILKRQRRKFLLINKFFSLILAVENFLIGSRWFHFIFLKSKKIFLYTEIEIMLNSFVYDRIEGWRPIIVFFFIDVVIDILMPDVRRRPEYVTTFIYLSRPSRILWMWQC